MPVNKLDGAILRKHKLPFDIISRDAVQSLSGADAMAMFVFMATMPDNWRFNKKHLKDRLGLGEDRYSKAMKELRDRGFVTDMEVRRTNGTLEGRVILFDQSTEIPENRHLGKPELREISTLKEQENELKNKREGQKRTRFVPPTLEEVRERCLQMGYVVNPESFWNFYESKGWMVGKNKMKKWESALANWNHKEKGNGRTNTTSYNEGCI